MSFQELDWPIFQTVEANLLRSISKSDWVTLSSRADRKRPTGDGLIRCTSCKYPKFEDDCQIPDLNEMYMELFGFVENGTFVEIGASGK